MAHWSFKRNGVYLESAYNSEHAEEIRKRLIDEKNKNNAKLFVNDIEIFLDGKKVRNDLPLH